MRSLLEPAKARQNVSPAPLEESALVRPGRVEDDVVEAELDVALREGDVLVRVVADAARFGNGVGADDGTVLFGHLGRVDLLVVHGGHEGARPKLAPCLNRAR